MKYIILLSFLVSLLLFGSCTEEYPIRGDSTYKRLVVDGSISTDTMAHCIHLSYSADYFYNKPMEPVRNADVYITDGSLIYRLTEDTAKYGFYYTTPEVYGIPGKTYTLNISNVDINEDRIMENYSAKSYLPAAPKPDSIKVVNVDYQFFKTFEIRYFGWDPADERNYYYFRASRNGKLMTDTITESYPTEDEMYNGQYIKNLGVYNLYKEKSEENIQAGDTITLDICGITKDYYRFLNDVLLEVHGSDPFGGQPANVFTNMNDSKMAVGFFNAYSVERSTYIVKQKDIDNVISF